MSVSIVAKAFSSNNVVTHYNAASGGVDASGLVLVISAMLVVVLYAWAAYNSLSVSIAGVRKGEPTSVMVGLLVMTIIVALIGILI